MVSLEEARDIFSKDRYATVLSGIVIDEIGENYAKCSMKVTEDHRNANGIIMGGAIYTLADFAFAGASNAMGHTTVSTGLNINFIRPGSGKKLIAKARKIHHGRATCLYQVDVFNEEKKLVAAVSVSGFIVDDQPVAG